MVKISVQEIIGNTIAMSTEDGKKLFEILFKNIQDSNKIELSFNGVDMLISHFLNESIGKLYEKFGNWETLDKVISYKGIDEDDLELLNKKVIPTAKNHFKEISGKLTIKESILDD